MQVDGDAEQSMDVGGTGDKQSILNLSKKRRVKHHGCLIPLIIISVTGESALLSL
jgi:hypothetical protein